MTISNSTAITFASKLEAIAQSPLLSKLKLDLQGDSNAPAAEGALHIIIDEFFKQFKSSLGSSIAALTSSTNTKLAKENLYEFLAQNPALCERINAQLDADLSNPPDIYLTGLNQKIINVAVHNQNLQFILLGLKAIDPHMISANIDDQFPLLSDGAIKLALNRVPMQPLNTYLTGIRQKYGESSFRWQHNEGPLFGRVNEIQTRNTITIPVRKTLVFTEVCPPNVQQDAQTTNTPALAPAKALRR